MKELILIGNPNVGKSSIYNSLTGQHTYTGNRHGVTVSSVSAEITLGKEKFLITDLPGIYSFQGYTKEESVAAEYIKNHPKGYYLLCIDARTIKSALPFIREFSALNRKCVVLLTMYRSFLQKGGFADLAGLSDLFGVPVVIFDSYDKKSVESFKKSFREESFSPLNQKIEKPDISAYRYSLPRETLLEKVLYNKYSAIPVFVALLGMTFYLTFGNGAIGQILKTLLEELIGVYFLNWLLPFVTSDVLKSLLADGIIRPVGGVLSFLPQLAILYALLQFFEESGYMSSLAFSLDGLFSKLGVNGRTVFCILLGYGCTAQAIFSTKNTEDDRFQSRAVYALSFIPCSAKLPVFLTVLSSFFSDPLPYVLLFYGLGTISALLFFLFFSEEKPKGLIMEIPDLCIPNGFIFVKNLLFRLKGFIMKVLSVVFLFSVVVWALSSFNFSFEYVSVEYSMLANVCNALKFFLYPIGIEDWRMTFALLSGLIAKENVAGALQLFYPNGLNISVSSAFACCIFLLYCSPCISAIAAAAKELGMKKAIGYAVLQTVSALLFAYAVCSVYAFYILLIALFLMVVKRFCIEKFYRKRRNNVKKIYR